MMQNPTAEEEAAAAFDNQGEAEYQPEAYGGMPGDGNGGMPTMSKA